jgi:hypothetical protein
MRGPKPLGPQDWFFVPPALNRVTLPAERPPGWGWRNSAAYEIFSMRLAAGRGVPQIMKPSKGHLQGDLHGGDAGIYLKQIGSIFSGCTDSKSPERLMPYHNRFLLAREEMALVR